LHNPYKGLYNYQYKDYGKRAHGMDEITLYAYGKINLALDVTGRRPDGYHLVRMIMQTVGIYDIVTVRKAPDSHERISLTCSRPEVPAGPSNLAWKAAAAVMEHAGLKENISIHIEKNIPMAAGMAGGSTDAAAVIRAMNSLFGLKLTQEKMDAIAVKLGADVPFCLRKGTYLAEGIGEVLTKLPDAPKAYVLIVNPPFEVSTAAVYRELDGIEDPVHPDIDRLLSLLKEDTLDAFAAEMGNILELVTIKDNPLIGEIRDKIMSAGALGSMMTGSGPTVFGLFDEPQLARKACIAFSGEAENGRCILTEFIR